MNKTVDRLSLGAVTCIAVIILAIVVCAAALASAMGDERPYSCHMFDETQKRCAANSFGPCYV